MSASHVVVPLTNKSTNGRLIVGLARAQLRALAWLSPALADRRAAALFFTPRPTGRVAEPAVPGLRAERFAVTSGGRRLAAWSWGEGEAVLLVHGWNGHGGQLSGFVEPLVRSGFRAVAFDQPAHARSAGRRTTVLEMAEAIQAVARVAGPLRAVVAHSLGATATALALHDHLPAGRAVLLAPPAEAPYFARAMAAQLGLSEERTAGMIAQVERVVGVHLGSIDVRRFAEWIRQPALVFHDPGDREVPFEHGRAIADAWPGARLVPLHGLGHKRLLGDEAVIRETVAFLRQGRARTAALG